MLHPVLEETGRMVGEEGVRERGLQTEEEKRKGAERERQKTVE